MRTTFPGMAAYAAAKHGVLSLTDMLREELRETGIRVLGLVPGANFGDGCAIFEAVHGSAPDIAGRNIANPTALLRSAVLMLRNFGEQEAANRIRAAVEKVYRNHERRTRDVGGTATTTEYTDAVIEAMQEEPVEQPVSG